MISFIIPAHNEETLIGRTLAAINEAARGLGDGHEIIVVNDASTDRTEEIAGEHGARVIAVNHRQIAATRNSGARAATGELLFFIDADTMVTPKAVLAAVRALHRGAIGGGTSAVHFDAGHMPAYARLLARLLPPVLHALRLAPGCFVFCTRRGYLAAGGYNEGMHWGEEVAFANRLKRKGRFVMLRDPVITSGRKLRSHTAMELLRVAGQLLLRRREGLEYWYGPREVVQ
jgi:glycosyltransferase involved in cell wall biosynthesis